MEPQEFLDKHPLRTLVAFPPEYMDQAMALAFQSFQAGRYDETETLCRGLLALDHHYWWSYSLYAATLLKLGKVREALVQINLGLAHEPEQPKLLEIKKEILTVAAALAVRAKRPAQTEGHPTTEASVSRKEVA
jgi:predicted Zn-dependent protease